MVSRIDSSGRLADRSPIRVLGWSADRAVNITYRNGTFAVTAKADGRWKISRRGYLLLPASVRRSCGVAAGDRLLVLSYPERSSLVAYTMGTLDLMINVYTAQHEAL